MPVTLPDGAVFSHALYYGSRRYEVYTLFTNDDPASNPAYEYMLVGKRGATYKLLRNKPNPRFLFAVDSRGKSAAVFENEWFTDRDRNGKPISLKWAGH